MRADTLPDDDGSSTTSGTEHLGPRAWLEALSAPAALLDPSLRIIAVNTRLATLTGRTLEAHEGLSLEEIAPDVDPAWEEALRSVVHTGFGRQGLEHVQREPGGAARVWRVDAEPISDSGRIVGLLAQVTEVTQHHRAARALEEGDRRGAALAELARRLLAASGMRPTVDAVLDGARSVAGADRAALFEVTPDGLRALDVGDYAAAVREAVAEAVPEQSPVGFVARTREPLILPSLQPVLERFAEIAPIASSSGDESIAVLPLLAEDELVGVLHLGYDAPRDLTPGELDDLDLLAQLAAAALVRLRAADAQARARLLLEAVVDNIPVGVSITDARGAPIVTNPPVTAIWRGARRSADIDDYDVWRGRHPDGRLYQNHEWPIARSLATGEVIVDERVDIERFDGTTGTISISSAPVRDAAGTITAGVAVILDVTADRAAQESRDAFVGVLSHELRTPVTSIVAGASVLARVAATDPGLARSVAADIATEALRLQRLVEDVLVLSRVDRGVDLGRHEPVLVHHVVRRSVAEVSGQWPDLRVEVDDRQRPPIAAGDETYLTQVLTNLLSNAAKYGDGRAWVRLAGVHDGAVIEVRDGGPGIDPEDRDRIFGLFYRAPGAAARASGAGIGLFVCRQLVGAMGGTLAWVPEPGGTGCFRIWLPAFAGGRADD